MKMDELKKLFVMSGIKNISTYIQSGNVVFDSPETDTAVLQEKIEKKLFKALGYEVTVFLRTFDEVRNIIKQNPFEKEMEEMGLYVSMLSAVPDAEGLKALQLLIGEQEQVKVLGTAAYILCIKNGYGNSKLSNVSLEKKMKVKSTTRNWATMNKILALE